MVDRTNQLNEWKQDINEDTGHLFYWMTPSLPYPVSDLEKEPLFKIEPLNSPAPSHRITIEVHSPCGSMSIKFKNNRIDLTLKEAKDYAEKSYFKILALFNS